MKTLKHFIGKIVTIELNIVTTDDNDNEKYPTIESGLLVSVDKKGITPKTNTYNWYSFDVLFGIHEIMFVDYFDEDEKCETEANK